MMFLLLLFNHQNHDHMIIKYRPDIDGLRAVAVLLVVVYHAFPSALPGGFIGVDIFFVISGFLITSILKKEMQSGSYSILEFYRRRIDRIFPALLVVMFAVFAFGWFTMFADEFMQMGKQMAGGAGFIANIVLYSETGYFNTLSVTKPFLHLWSLGIEEQYYLVFPIILYFTYKRNINPLLAISTLFAISFLLNIYQIQSDVEKTFYLPQYRFWELLAGSILAILIHGDKAKSINGVVSTFLSTIALAVILFTSLAMTSSVPFPGWYALIPVTTSFILIMTAQYSMPVRFVLSSKPFVFFGLISYPLYLWHWPLLSMARIINGDIPDPSVRYSLVALSIVMAVLTYYVIERSLKGIKSWSKKTIPLLVLMVIAGSLGLYAFLSGGAPERSTVKVSKVISAQLNGAMWQYSKNDICLSRFHFPDVEKLPWWFCELKRDADPDLVLLGNSFANHLYPGIADNPKLKDLNVLSIGTDDVTDGILHAKNNSVRKDQYDYINNIIISTKSVKTVIISGLNPSPNKEYVAALNKRISLIESAGKKVIVFLPHVKLSNNIKACFARPLKKPEQDCITDTSEVMKIRNAYLSITQEVKEQNPGTLFFDPNTAFCDERTCSSVIDGMPVYRDDYKHLSEYASKKVGFEFYRWAKSNVPNLVK
ncbi:TPA: acyltransferase family protein [Escherichia coli]